MLYYKEADKWKRIAAHLGDNRDTKVLCAEFYSYVKSNRRKFGDEEVILIFDAC
jgi:hypothetical protein